MKELKVLDLFSETQSISKEFRKRGGDFIMEQIFHTMTEDGAREIGIYSNGEDLKMCIDEQEIFTEENIELPLTQEDIEFYIGVADLYYETNIEVD